MHEQGWPQTDTSALAVDTVELPVQINGKVREHLTVSISATTDEIKARTLALSRIAGLLEGKNVIKFIVVPGKIINLVVK